MGLVIALITFALAGQNPTDASQQQPGKIYQTRKSLPDLQKCLTDKLSERGDVTAVKMKDSTTLMLRWGGENPMLIDLAPPTVTVTTRFASGTRPIVEECL